MEERRYPGGTKRVPDEDDDDGFGAAASQDSLSVCAASVGAFDLRRDDLEKLANGAGKSTPKYDERDRRERIEMLNKRHLLHVTSGRQTRDERNGALSPEEQQRDLEKQDEWEKRGRPELVNKQRATRVTSWRWMEDDRKSANILSPEEEQRADALEKLLHFDVGAKEKIEVERYLAKLRHTDEDIEMFVPEGNKFQFRTPERERGVADGQGDINRSSLSQIRQRFQTRSDMVLSQHVGNSSKDKVPLLRAEIEKLTQANSLLRKRESAASYRVEQLEAEKSDLVRSQAELQRTCDTLKNQTSQDEHQEMPQKSLDSLEQLLSMRDDSSPSQLSTIAEDAEGEKQIRALQEERDDMEKRLSTLRRDVEIQRSLKEAAERDRAALRANIDQLETELFHLRTENTHLATQLQSSTSNKRGKSPANKSMSGSDPQIVSTAQAQTPTAHHGRSLSLGSGHMAASVATSQAGTGALSLSSLPGEKWGSGVSTSTASLPNSSSVTPYQALSPFGSDSNLEQDQEMLMVSPEVQQSLADSLRGCSNMQQLIQAVLTYSTGVQSDRFRHALIEKERLQARLSKLESESDLLRLSLGECKDYAEYYSLISRQYESNNTILTACLYFTSRVVQIYEKVLGLVEADMGVMNVACRMAGVRNPHELVGNTAKQAWGSSGSGASHENLAAARHATARLRSAESEAKDLLQTFSMYASSSGLGSYIDGDSTGYSNKSQENLLAVSSANRQLTSSQSSGYSSIERDPSRFYEERSPIFSRTSSNSTTSSGGGTAAITPTMVDVESMREVCSRLKDQAMGLKLQRTKREKSLVEINTNAFPDLPRDLTYYNCQSQIERDFEHALLLLELATVKDDKVDLKAKNYLVEQELRSYELRLQTSTAQEQSYMVHIEHLKAELKEQTRRRRKMQRELKDLKDKQAAQAKDDQQSSDASSLLVSRTQSLPLDHSSRPTDQHSHLQQELNEAERRERSLRLRNQELGETFEVYIKSHQEQTNQQQSYVNDLKKAYDSLVSAYNKLKKRFQVQQSAHEQEIAALRTELSVLQKAEETNPQEDRLKYLELAQEETNL